jgi:hypothetical protein
MVLAGMVLLAGVIFFHEEKPRVKAVESHILAPTLTYAKIETPQPTADSHFLDNINLSYDSVPTIPDSGLNRATPIYDKTLPAAGSGKLRPKPDDTAPPVITVADRKLNYEVLGTEDFSLKFNLTPGYPNPEALIPTRLDPGIGLSIKF